MPVAPILDADPASVLSATASAGHPLSFYLALDGAPSRATMVRAIRANRMRATKVGGEYRVTPADFSDWAARRQAPANAASSQLTPSLRQWANDVAATAPPLSPAQAAEVARQLITGGSAA